MPRPICIKPRLGCLDSNFDNYDQYATSANTHDGTKCKKYMCKQMADANKHYTYQYDLLLAELGNPFPYTWTELSYNYPAYHDYVAWRTEYANNYITAANRFSTSQMATSTSRTEAADDLVVYSQATCDARNVIIGCTTGCSNETEKTWPSQSRPCYSNWKPKNNYDLSPSLCSYWGCQDSTRANYVPSATIPLTCRGFVPYCKDPTAFNYWDCLHLYPVFNSATSTLTFIKQYDVRTTYWAARKEKYGYEATMHDQSMCVVLGCMDTTSVYYNSKATFSPAALRTARRPPAATMAADCPLATAECTLPIVHCRLRRRPVTFSKTQPTTHAIKSMVSMCLAIPYPK